MSNLLFALGQESSRGQLTASKRAISEGQITVAYCDTPTGITFSDKDARLYLDLTSSKRIPINAYFADIAHKDKDGNIIDSTYLKLSGGTMTNTITFGAVATPISINYSNGGIKLDSQGNIIPNSNSISWNIYKNSNKDEMALKVAFDTGEVTATKFIGTLQGNADSASKASGDNDTIVNTYATKNELNTHKHLVTYTPSGTINQPTFTGSQSATTSTDDTETIYQIADVGKLPTLEFSEGSLPSLVCSVQDGCLSLSLSDGSLPSINWNAGQLPLKSPVNISKSDHTHNITPQGSISNLKFTGNLSTITTNVPMNSLEE